MSSSSKVLGIFHQYIKKCGLKRTRQRDLILTEFLQLEGHVTPEELYQVIRLKDPNVGLSTIYRTLKIMSECNIAREMKSTDGTAVFEQDFGHSHHDHLYCTSCGTYIEFVDESIEILQQRAAQERGFRMEGHRLLITGICAQCQQKEEADKETNNYR